MYSFEARLAAREALYVMTLDLVAEFAHLPAGAVIGLVGRAREDLLRAGVRDGLVDATEAMARTWLNARAMAHA
ncbi:MAG TPA: hypothetical protein VNQ77_05100 [Frankiaceae bacterium]|nr:hypothetical protein [Frankiaceae bacterium]